MIDTVYLHLEFQNKSGKWSLNLPFVCNQCGICCKIDDFLTAGPAKVNPFENSQLNNRLKEIYEEMGRKWESDEAKYDQYITSTPCPFLKEKKCSIYEYRPDGCRQFPNTPFGMLSQDCEVLDRFKKQTSALCKGRKSKKTYHFTTEPIKQAKLSKEQFQDSLSKLHRTGITEDEKALFESLNN
jgi:Fe-S-cluster containining protein